MRDNGKINEALREIYNFGGIDGVHHKQWLLNRLVLILTGTNEEYNAWVKDYCNGEDGPITYEWDTGIAP